MRSIEDKGCYNHGPPQEITNSSGINFEFHKGNGTNRGSQHRTALGKPTPSKWDDAQKWLVGLSRGGGGVGGGGEKNQSKTKPRNSNADDTRLIAPVPQKEKDYSSGDDGEEEKECHGSGTASHLEVETKKVDCDESIWRVNKAVENSKSAVRSICVRDMGTEMTPIASLEPSRTGTPIRARTPAARSPISSGSSTPVRCQHQHGVQTMEKSYQTGESKGEVFATGNVVGATRWSNRDGGELNASNVPDQKNSSEQGRKLSPLETRAMAWDEAERAKYMARFKREEVKIQAWENHEKRKAEMEMKRMEVKAERLKSRAQERLANKLAATRRIAEEKRANAEAKLNEKSVRTSERADYIRRTGHLPSSCSFIKLPSLCWSC